MFHAYESLDSIDMMPDRKGRVKLDYRKKNAEYLNKYRSNLYNGGIYFARKANYDAAYGMFDTYIDTRRQPLFSDYAAYNVDSLYAKPAFWAIFCAYKANRADSVFKYSDLALQDKNTGSALLCIYPKRIYWKKTRQSMWKHCGRGLVRI